MATLKPALGIIIQWHYDPALVVASFFASLLGTTLTVELLNKKRPGNSWVSRLQLLACAASMGLIGIWCMHFIGNRAIVLADGSRGIQLAYSPGFTTLSCFLPVIGLSIAFYIAELRIKTNFTRRTLTVLTGFFAGMSIVGMHYVGNLGISNYHLLYRHDYIVGACIIAVGACIIALMLFFYFKERWINVFWKRLACALLLSCAVCGMHYTATVGSAYMLVHPVAFSNTARNLAVIVAGVLCAVAGLACLSLLFYNSLRQRQLAALAQQVNIACAYFDAYGNVLVTNEGTLPSQKIAKRFYLQRFDDEFNTAHPVFHWIWKVSNSWDAVADLIPRMRRHLRYSDRQSQPDTRRSSKRVSIDEESYNDQTLVFRESFCVAAADLCDRLHITLPDIGVLFDRVIGTGTHGASRPLTPDSPNPGSMPSAVQCFEKGQILFFTKQLNNAEADHFAALGFRWAPPARVEGMIAKTMQIPIQTVSAHIKNLYASATNPSGANVAKEGTYITCFAALGRVNKQFDVLVTRANQAELPDAQLSKGHISTIEIEFLRRYDGWSAARMLADLKQKQTQDNPKERHFRGFVTLMIATLSSLAFQISNELFGDLTFNARPLVAQYGGTVVSPPAMILGLTRLLDIHQSTINKPERVAFVPLEFLRVRTAFCPGSLDRSLFRATAHTEFTTLLSQVVHEEMAESREQSKRNSGGLKLISRWTSRETSDATCATCDANSERGLFAAEPEQANTQGLGLTISSNRKLWGSILTTTDTVILSGKTNASAVEMQNVGPTAVVATTTVPSKLSEGTTIVDRLYNQVKRRGIAKLSDPA